MEQTSWAGALIELGPATSSVGTKINSATSS
jgi:hypothetical protein